MTGRELERALADLGAHLEHPATRRLRFVYVKTDVLARRVQRHAVVEQTKIGDRIVGRRRH